MGRTLLVIRFNLFPLTY